MVAELVAAIVLVLGSVAELLHRKRCLRAAPLVYGPALRPQLWVRLTPFLRVAGLAAAAWGIMTLLLLPPKVYRVKTVDEDDYRHLLVVLDVSPSMKLQDAGADLKLSRTKRVVVLMESFFQRVVMQHVRMSVIAVYTGAKPVVVDTKDIEVIRNILDDLPLHQAFEVGKTDLLTGIAEAAKVARGWKPGSATLLLITDGDTVSPTGMPRMPASVSEVLVIGVGDPRTGKFIDGHLSRQDVPTLRQIALRLKGIYHDGNQRHIPTDVLRRLSGVQLEDEIIQLSRREYALIAVIAGALLLALLPLALTFWGVRWRPGVRPRKPRPEEAMVH